MELKSFEEKQQRKLERFQELAEKTKKEAIETREQASKMAEAIPFGQPILVGHHSEQRDRNYRKKIDNKFRKSVALTEKAEHYENKVKNIVNPKSISSDDPEAIIKLKSEIEELENDKLAYDRKTYKINPKAQWFENGSEHHRKLELESLTRKIRDKKKRIEELQALEKTPDFDEIINSVRFFSDKVENRIKIEFPGKPAQEIITQLKSHGFHWSPYNKVWQRMLNSSGLYALDRIKELLR